MNKINENRKSRQFKKNNMPVVKFLKKKRIFIYNVFKRLSKFKVISVNIRRNYKR